MIDLGSDNYDLPGYFGEQCWSYYRLRTEGHNTIQVDRREQLPSTAAMMEKDGTTSFITAGAKVTCREASILSPNEAVIFDQIAFGAP